MNKQKRLLPVWTWGQQLWGIPVNCLKGPISFWLLQETPEAISPLFLISNFSVTLLPAAIPVLPQSFPTALSWHRACYISLVMLGYRTLTRPLCTIVPLCLSALSHPSFNLAPPSVSSQTHEQLSLCFQKAWYFMVLCPIKLLYKNPGGGDACF